MSDALDATPHSVESEQAVLGAILLDNAVLAMVRDIIGPDDLFVRQHRLIYEAMLELSRRNTSVDLLTVSEHLAERDELVQVGGASFVAELAERVPTTVGARAYAERVRQFSLRRRLITLLADASIHARSRGDCFDATLVGYAAAFDGLIQDAGASSRERRFTEYVSDAVTAIDARAEGAPSGAIGTGLRDVDDKMGGFFPGRQYIVAGRTSLGKSAMALTMARHICDCLNIGLGIISCEMSTEQIIQREISQVSGVPLTSIRRRQLHGDWLRRVHEAAERVASWPLQIVDMVIDLPAIEMTIRRQVGQGARIIIVDYVGLIRHPERKMPRWEQVGEIGKSLRQLAKRLQVSLVTVCQVNRELAKEQDKRPQLWHLRDAGSLEEHSDAVLFVHRPWYYDRSQPDDQAEVIIAKDRDGETGIIPVRWDVPTASFADVEMFPPQGGDEDVDDAS